MQEHVTQNKALRLYLILGAFFLTNALVAEFIGVKIFSLEKTLGIREFNWSFLGIEGTLNFTTGVLLWPIVFVITDLINEYFGRRGVRFLSVMAAILIAYSFGMIYLGIKVVPADFWIGMNKALGIEDMQLSFSVIFGQSLWIIVGSLVAFLIGQMVDALTFTGIKKLTGEGKLYLRATGSTLISQFIDSFVVLYIAFVIPGFWTLDMFLAIGVVNYTYKLLMAVALTPALYIAHAWIDKALGEKLATDLKNKALKSA